ncbi:hypothetical protein Tco_0514294 [Tanacetum coccineum]
MIGNGLISKVAESPQEERKFWVESTFCNSGNTRDGGKTLWSSSEMSSEAKRYLVKSFEESEKVFFSEAGEGDQRIKEETVKDREREKKLIVVKRRIREAREQAFTEARERVERAVVERANAEVRQRVMVDALEKIAKASFDKTSTQSKLRVERG